MKLRPIEKDDITALLGRTLPHSTRGITIAADDGTPLAIAGVMYGNPTQCYSVVNDREQVLNTLEGKRLIVKGMRQLRALLERCSGRVYALPQDGESTAPGFLAHVGFEQINEDIYQWPDQKQS